MMQVTLCITQQHDLRLVFTALLVCLIGSAATIQLFGRILSASGTSRESETTAVKIPDDPARCSGENCDKFLSLTIGQPFAFQ